jgi:hypothetical protein
MRYGTGSNGSATTTAAVRRARQHSQESLRVLAKRHGVNPKTIAKWKARSSVSDVPTGPKEPRSTVLSAEEAAVIVAFRRHTLLPLDDCLYALQPTVPHLTRSSLHRCLQRHGTSRLPQVEGEASAKRKFKAYQIGYFHIPPHLVVAPREQHPGKILVTRPGHFVGRREIDPELEAVNGDAFGGDFIVDHTAAGGHKDYVAGWRQRAQEMFVPLEHPPGHAQVDFGEAIGVIGGVERQIHFFAFDLPHSDTCFVVADPSAA